MMQRNPKLCNPTNGAKSLHSHEPKFVKRPAAHWPAPRETERQTADTEAKSLNFPARDAFIVRFRGHERFSSW